MSVLVSLELVQVTCCVDSCGVSFGLALHHHKSLRESHESFFCPNGHSQHFPGKSEVEQAREDAKRAWERVEEARRATAAERRSHAATKGHLVRVKARAKAGVCLHCNRTFQNVARHMAAKHAVDTAKET